MKVYLLTSFLIMDNDITAAFTSLEKLQAYKEAYIEFNRKSDSRISKDWQPFDFSPTEIELDPVFSEQKND